MTELTTPPDVENRRNYKQLLDEVVRLNGLVSRQSDVIADLHDELNHEHSVNDGLRSMCNKLMDELQHIRRRVNDILGYQDQ